MLDTLDIKFKKNQLYLNDDSKKGDRLNEYGYCTGNEYLTICFKNSLYTVSTDIKRVDRT